MKIFFLITCIMLGFGMHAQKTFDAMQNSNINIGAVMDMKADGVCEIYMIQNLTNNNGPYLRCYYRPLGSFVSTVNYALNSNVNMNGVQRIVYNQAFTQNGVSYYKCYYKPVIIRANPPLMPLRRVQNVNYANRVTAWNEYNGFTYGGQPQINQQAGVVNRSLIWGIGGFLLGRILK